SSDPRHDQALVRAVRYLGSPESTGVSGQAVDIELPDPPRISEALLPEVRAALDVSMRQDEDVDHWSAAPFVDTGAPSGSSAEGVAGRTEPAYDREDEDYDDDYEEFDLHWSEELGLRRGAPAL